MSNCKKYFEDENKVDVDYNHISFSEYQVKHFIFLLKSYLSINNLNLNLEGQGFSIPIKNILNKYINKKLTIGTKVQ